jgi:3-deoxy-D-manno-octulosonate 8-phosphate phosphatase (KDO 8-P phosphatase)
MGACPADAEDGVRHVARFVSSKEGGRGAVRDFIEYLIASRRIVE